MKLLVMERISVPMLKSKHMAMQGVGEEVVEDADDQMANGSNVQQEQEEAIPSSSYEHADQMHDQIWSTLITGRYRRWMSLIRFCCYFFNESSSFSHLESIPICQML